MDYSFQSVNYGFFVNRIAGGMNIENYKSCALVMLLFLSQETDDRHSDDYYARLHERVRKFRFNFRIRADVFALFDETSDTDSIKELKRILMNQFAVPRRVSDLFWEEIDDRVRPVKIKKRPRINNDDTS